MSIKIGDWVTGYSAGFYRVERIVPLKHTTIVVLKKGLTAKLKPSVGWDHCAISLCERVSDVIFNEIQSILNSNSKFSKRFNEYVIPEIKSLYNTRIKVKEDKELKALEDVLESIKQGKTLQEINRLLEERGIEIAGSVYSEDNKDLQLTCFDYETNADGELIYRDACVY